MHRQSANDDHALLGFNPQTAACIDHHVIRCCRRGQRKSQLCAHARAKADRFGSAISAAKPSIFQAKWSDPTKTRTGIGPHPQSANDEHMLLGFNPPAAACALITTSFDSAGDRSAASYALHTQT